MTVLVASDALVAGEVRVVRLESALGPCVQGLHEKREKVPHPGLQHVLKRSVSDLMRVKQYGSIHDGTEAGFGSHKLWTFPQLASSFRLATRRLWRARPPT